MRSRGWLSVMSFLLLLTLVACSKPASNTAANPADQNTAAQPAGAGGSAPANNSAQPQASQAQPVVVPAGTTLTVRLGQAVGSKIS
jgi:hypothetical protein